MNTPSRLALATLSLWGVSYLTDEDAKEDTRGPLLMLHTDNQKKILFSTFFLILRTRFIEFRKDSSLLLPIHQPSTLYLDISPYSIIMDLQQANMPRTPFDIFELLSKILSFLPRYIVNSEYDSARESNLMCAGVCVNWHKISRLFAFWRVELKTEEEARRFLAALMSNEAFAERTPGWPQMISTRSLVLGNVNGLFLILILSLGETAAQILRLLPKLEVLRRDDSPMSFEELSSVSKNLVSLRCMKGFDVDTAQFDISSLIFKRLEKFEVKSEIDSDFQFIATILKNSIPQG
jgi:hypothetical protein